MPVTTVMLYVFCRHTLKHSLKIALQYEKINHFQKRRFTGNKLKVGGLELFGNYETTKGRTKIETESKPACG